MKIALVNVSSMNFKYAGNAEYPLGLLYIGSMVKQHHDISILDYASSTEASLEEIKTTLEEMQPDVVGISTTLDVTLRGTRLIASATKEVCPGATIILGGITAYFLKDQLIAEPDVDMIIKGEGEFIFKECIQHLDSGRMPGDIKGLLFKKDGRVVETPAAPLLRDLDLLPFPDFALMGEEIRKNLPVSSSRGCGLGCVYCSSTSYWGRWRARTAGNVVQEIETLVEKYGIDKIHFVDENFGFNPKRVREFCRLLKERKLNIFWGSSARPEMLDRDLIEEMYNAGCKGIFVGAESGSERILENINRNYTPAQVEKVVNDCVDVGIVPTAAFIIGLPGETKEDAEKTLRLMRKLNTFNIELAMLYPLYGTPIYDNPEKYGMKILESRLCEKRFNLMKSAVENGSISTADLESLYYKGLGIIKRKTHNKSVFLKKILKEDTYVFQ
jgi:radical SAM superfamily enzyme YgiQ (UPF0313 family)